MWNKLFLSSLCGMCLLTLVGCSDGRPPLAPVEGTVTYKGQPVAEADVSFIPASGRPAYGKTDSQGHFQLTTFEPNDGATIGSHAVTIVKQTPKGAATTENPYVEYQSVLPEKYGQPKDSPLKADVTSDGENSFTFELEG